MNRRDWLVEDVINQCDCGLIWIDQHGSINHLNEYFVGVFFDNHTPHATHLDELFNQTGFYQELLKTQKTYIGLGNKNLSVSLKPYQEGYLISCQEVVESETLLMQILELNEAIKTGDVSTFRASSAQGDLLPESLQGPLHALESTLDGIFKDIDCFSEILTQVAECDLEIIPTRFNNAVFKTLESQLLIGVSCLTQALKQTSEFSESISSVSEDIAQKNQDLVKRTNDQAMALQSTSASMEELSSTVKLTAENSSKSKDLMLLLDKDAQNSAKLVKSITGLMKEIGEHSTEIESFVETINGIAFQTQILALNAAVEAARAGEDGRGFAVVASEVRSLAQRSTNVTQDISRIINMCIDSVNEGDDLIQEAEMRLSGIVASTRKNSDLIQEISHANHEQSIGVQQASDAILKISQLTEDNDLLAKNLFSSTSKLDHLSDYLIEAVNVFKLSNGECESGKMHAKLHDIVVKGTIKISQRIERGIAEGDITQEAFFRQDYQPIEGTDPQKYTTSFDQFTDEVLPPIQEQFLKEHPFIVYAMLTDSNGYVPTHNVRFTQPLTNDYMKDLLGNRTKRKFEDRVGITCGTHEDDAKVQTYRRDTGELMFDISAPIYINGKHWGGFRIGYRVE